MAFIKYSYIFLFVTIAFNKSFGQENKKITLTEIESTTTHSIKGGGKLSKQKSYQYFFKVGNDVERPTGYRGEKLVPYYKDCKDCLEQIKILNKSLTSGRVASGTYLLSYLATAVGLGMGLYSFSDKSKSGLLVPGIAIGGTGVIGCLISGAVAKKASNKYRNAMIKSVDNYNKTIK